MRGKKPTRQQRNFLKKWHKNVENWLGCKDMPEEMVIEHRYSDEYRTIRKVRVDVQ